MGHYRECPPRGGSIKVWREAAAISSLGGYDEEFVNAVEEDFLCPICHRFCRQCLRLLRRGGNPKWHNSLKTPRIGLRSEITTDITTRH